jgi:hypothetical protein
MSDFKLKQGLRLGRNGFITFPDGTTQSTANSGSGGGSGSSESLTTTITNSVNSFKVVSLNTNSETTLASATNISHVNKVAGIIDATGKTVTFGTLSNADWAWTPNQILYLGSDGDLVTTSTIDKATFSMKIGVALTSTKMLVQIGSPIIL